MRLFFLLLVSLPLFLFAQKNASTLRYDDYIYRDNIHTVTFTVEGFYLTMPVLQLDGNTKIELEFDDFQKKTKYYYYRIIQCDADWKPTTLSDMEYVNGFAQDLIREYQFSFRTITNFTHYRLTLPNESTTISKSGNYLLVVYEDSREESPIITRRFVVIDPKVQISTNFTRPINPEKFRTHHEIDFEVAVDKFAIRNPTTELRATILQNGRWDNAIVGIPPNFIRAGVAQFDYQDKIVFPGGKEFRYLDMRSYFLPSIKMQTVDRLDDRIEVGLGKDKTRTYEPYFQFSDIDGYFVVENKDQAVANNYQSQTRNLNSNNLLPTTVDTNQLNTNTANAFRLQSDSRDPFNNDLSSDYAHVLFSLSSNQALENEDVYLVGKLSDWKLKPEFKMTFNEATRSYVANVLLKQGYYNYAYATTPTGQTDKPIDTSEFEGNWWETENEYTILIYYRPFGARYDQVIGWYQFRSNRF